jgi:hypothetical protein
MHQLYLEVKKRASGILHMPVLVGYRS